MLQHLQIYIKANCLYEKVQLQCKEEHNLFMDVLLLPFKRLFKKTAGNVSCS